MDSWCTGILKGLTLGGFGIWANIAFLIILPNAIDMNDQIDSMGIGPAAFDANPKSIEAAKYLAYIAIIGIMLKGVFVGTGANSVASARKGQDEAEPGTIGYS